MNAYTLKKVIPRLVIAIIAIQLSWFLFTQLIHLINLTAYSIEGIIYAPFGGADQLGLSNILSSASGGGSNGLFFTGLIVAAGGAAAAALTVGGIFALALTAIFGLFLGFFLLMIRKVLIVFLLIISPLALVAWILPGTEKYFKMWWESFFKLLLLFPMLAGLIAVGRVFAYLAAKSSINDVVSLIIVIVGCFGPFFLIPKLFGLAGTAFASISGAVTSRSRGGFAYLKGRRQQAQKANLERARSGVRFRGGTPTNLRGRANRLIQTGALVDKAGARPTRWRANVGAARSVFNKQEIEKNLKENADYQTWANNDTLNKYAAASRNEQELITMLRNSGDYAGRETALREDVARVERVRRGMSSDAFKQMTTMQAIAGGTAYGSAGETWKAVADAAGNDDSAIANMVANGRSSSMNAGRVDVGGAGFGDTFNTVRKLRDEPNYTADQANDFILSKVVEAQGPGVVTHGSMKPKAVEQLIPAMRTRLKTALDSKDQGAIDRELAIVASTYDSLSQSSPQLARLYGDQILRWDPTVNAAQQQLSPGASGPVIPGWQEQNTILQQIKDRRGSDVFQSTRREWESNPTQYGAGGPAPGPGSGAVPPVQNKPGGGQ